MLELVGRVEDLSGVREVRVESAHVGFRGESSGVLDLPLLARWGLGGQGDDHFLADGKAADGTSQADHRDKSSERSGWSAGA